MHVIFLESWREIALIRFLFLSRKDAKAAKEKNDSELREGHEDRTTERASNLKKYFLPSCSSCALSKIWLGGGLWHEICESYVNIARLVVPAWTAGTQVDMDVSGRICGPGCRQSMPT
jgi:hypothetical protein